MRYQAGAGSIEVVRAALREVEALIGRVPARVRTCGTTGVTIAIVCTLAWMLASIDPHRVAAAVPATPLFWLAFACYFLSMPVAEWVLYRRLWSLRGAGASAIFGKLVCNELLLGYSGDAYFFAWARRHVKGVSNHLSTIKDLALVSSLVGSGATLIALLLASPLLAHMTTAEFVPLMIGGICALASGSAILFFARRLIGLSPDQFRFVVAVDLVRTLAQVGCMIAMWHFAMPGVHVSTLAGLSALRMAITRLPLVPNKDMMFLGVAVTLLGHASALVATIAMVAAVVVLANLAIAAVIGSRAATTVVTRLVREADMLPTGRRSVLA